MRAVGIASGMIPQATRAPRALLGRNASRAPPLKTMKAMSRAPVTPCASCVRAPAALPSAARLMVPATGMPPANALSTLEVPCAISSLSLSHSSPSSSAQRLHTAALSRYVLTPMAMPGASSASASSLGSCSTAGGNSPATSNEMAPTQLPTLMPLAASAPPTMQHTSAAGNSGWILFLLFSISTKVNTDSATLPICHRLGCASSQMAAVP
mmetsp:Transcript_16603/g.40666  ORF Transcript_16603/g.40666 Transcript_16603/m.40666 type:complete len:211 (+) Transcript_16603:650-1282(+)